jgi:phage terminase large subunit
LLDVSRPRQVFFPPKFRELSRPHRWKVAWGGRGSAKSWSFARALVLRAYRWPVKILCCREYQTSIEDSVHALLKRVIEEPVERGGFEVAPWFDVGKYHIRSHVGAQFIFEGLHHNSDQIKSKEGVDICWVEEAHAVSDESWKFLVPTIRDEGKFEWLPRSEIWVSFNQHDEEDPTYQRLVVRTPPDAWVESFTWQDNPYFPRVLDEERRYHEETDPDSYEWVWGTSCRKIGSSVVMRGHYVVEAFEEPPIHRRIRPRYGLDFGFANDPSHLVREYVTTEVDGDHLWISHEGQGLSVELDDLPAMLGGGKATDETDREWPGVPGVREWPIYADGSRPETISYLNRKGFNCRAADKWEGCVEDGIAHMKRYRKIHIHQRCPALAREARLWSYKVDARTKDVLPTLKPGFDHGWDAARYGLDGEIQNAGGLGVWAKLGR